MFSYSDAGQMQQEVTFAEQYAKKHHDPLKRMVQRYATAWYRTDIEVEPSPENKVFYYIDFMRAQLTYNSPAALVEANWESVHRDVAQFMEECLYRWQSTYPLIENFDLCVRDALFGYGVMKIGMEESGGTQGEVGGRRPQIRPYLAHIPMEEWGCDPRCSHVKDARFQYHRYERDLDEIQGMRNIDPEALKRITDGYEQSGGPSNTNAGRVGLQPGQTADRDRQVLYDIWIPEAKMIATLMAGSAGNPQAQWLRQPRKWWGPCEGPFRVLGFCSVPGDPYPCSPLSPAMQAIEKYNAHLVAEAEEVGSTKRFGVVDSGATEVADAVLKAKNGEIIPIPNLKASGLQMMEMGGISKDRILHTDRADERIDRMLSMGEAQQGISNSDTATANNIAQGNSDVRVSHMRGIINHFCKSCYVGVGWYMFYDPNYEERISLTVPQQPAQQMPGMGMMGGGPGESFNPPSAQPNPAMGSAAPVGGSPSPIGASWPFQPTLAENPSQPGAMSFGYAPTPAAAPGQPAPQPQQPMGGSPMQQPDMGMPPQPQPDQAVTATVYGGVEGGWYDGIWFPPMTDVSWEDDFTVIIDPESTAYTSNQARQQDALALVSLAQTAYQMLATMPGMEGGVEYLVDTVGEAMNRRNLFAQLFPPQVVAQIRMTAQMQQAPMQVPNGASPAMAHQVGSFGGGTPSFPQRPFGGTPQNGPARTPAQPSSSGGPTSPRSASAGQKPRPMTGAPTRQ